MVLWIDTINTTYALGFLLLGAGILTLLTGTSRKPLKTAIPPLREPPKRRDSVQPNSSKDAYYNIEPLDNFDLDNEEPIKARPFKPKFHMTMAIENTTLSDLVAMDKTYHSRIQLRRSLLATQTHEVLGTNPKATPAVFELYKWLTATYLPSRFPALFTLSATGGLLNKTTAETLPPSPTSAAHALTLIGSHIDTDFLLLQPSTNPQDEEKYRLEAFITCFPSGFSTRSKLGLLLADIHGPVPAYKQKLEKSMDRFFATLPVGKIVRRWNWAVSTSGDLFCVAGNHATREEVEGAGQEQSVDLRTTFLRCERQTVHRLPETGAVVFAFKTYQYPIAELRDEGAEEAERLCEAIDGMGQGSVPEITVYKRQVVWGDKVKRFLRGEIEVDG